MTKAKKKPAKKTKRGYKKKSSYWKLSPKARGAYKARKAAARKAKPKKRKK